MTEPILNSTQLKEAERANARLSRLNEAEIKARFESEKAKLEADFRRKFKIQALEDAVDKAEETMHRAKKAVERATKEMHEAMGTKLSQLEARKADSLAGVAQASVERDFRLIGASLPSEAVALLGLDKIKVPRAIATEMKEDEDER